MTTALVFAAASLVLAASWSREVVMAPELLKERRVKGVTRICSCY